MSEELNPYNFVDESTDVDLLNNLLTKFIPIDRDNLEKDANKNIHEAMGVDHEEHKKKTSLFLDKLEERIKKRLEKLKS